MKPYAKIVLAFLVSVFILSACGAKYRVAVDLTTEERGAVNAEIEEAKADIRNFKSVQGTFPDLEVIRLARAYEKLGKLGSSIDLYEKWLGKYRAKTWINNLGRLYDQVGEFDLAVGQYQRLVDEYLDNGYLYDITWSYIHAAERSKGRVAIDYRKKAEKYFNAWQLALQKTDEQTQQAIKAIRAKEQTSGK